MFSSWKDEHNGMKYTTTPNLMSMYVLGNVQGMFSITESVIGKTVIQVIKNILSYSKNDLELLYEMCASGTHHNGRDLEWLKSEGMRGYELEEVA